MPEQRNESTPPEDAARYTPAHGNNGAEPKEINFDLTRQELHQGARRRMAATAENLKKSISI